MPQFEVTDKAGDYVAGRKVKRGDVLTLSATQAWYELVRGTIRRVGAASAPVEATKPKRR